MIQSKELQSYSKFVTNLQSKCTCRALTLKVEQHTLTDLVDADVVHDEIEPEAKPWVASVRPNKQIIFILRDEVHSSEVTCRGSKTDIRTDSLVKATQAVLHNMNN
jgi:hypothetical protein